MPSPVGPRSPLPTPTDDDAFVAVDDGDPRDADDVGLLRPVRSGEGFASANAPPAPSNLRELWTVGREGRLEDWRHWQLYGLRYQKVAHATVMLGLWAGAAFVGYEIWRASRA